MLYKQRATDRRQIIRRITPGLKHQLTDAVELFAALRHKGVKIKP
jgi:hypothetical protein